ncbi:MAG TPA: hypothetical protein PLM51_00240 [Bacillota bacterium]|nr:hypothetical protein [Bacillota bacterium]HRX91622.1 hypothetical protein [Candidatus Izemoplasmatales bacterium]
MKQYLILMRVFLKENFSLKRFLGIDVRKSKKKAILLGFLFLYAIGAWWFFFGLLFMDLAEVFDSLGVIELMLMYLFLYTTGMTLIMVLFRANGYLFKYKDFEILQPLPLKPNTVFMAKMTVMLIITYIGVFILAAPIAFAYFYYDFSIIGLLLFLIALPLMCLIPIVVFSFLSMIVARLASGFRNRNILNIISMLLLFLCIMAFSLWLNISTANDVNPLLNQQGLVEGMKEYYLPMGWFADAIHNHDILSFLLLFVSNTVPFALFVYLVAKWTVKINQKNMSVKTRTSVKTAVSQSQPVFQAIIRKEFRKFLSVPIYAVNAGFGLLMLMIAGILSVVYKAKIAEFMATITSSTITPEAITLLFVGFCITMVYTSAISLSLEGKNFWIIKSLPLEAKKVMEAKMAFNVLLVMPFAIVSLVLIYFGIGSTIINLLVMFLYTLSLSLASSAFGSFINLHFPKFEFLNETEVVKQSVGAMIGVFSGFGFLVISGLVYYWLADTIGSMGALCAASLINYVFFFVFLQIVDRTSESLFAKMSG